MKGISGLVFPRMRVVAMAVAMGCAMVAGTGSVSAAEPSAAIQGLIDKASTQGSLRVIVMLAVNTQLESFLSAPQVDDQRKQISDAQDKVISALETAPSRAVSSMQGLKRFDITPGFAVSVTADDIQLLQANPLVADIVEDIAVPPTLMDSIPLVGGSPTTGFSGYKGAGWAVAILDSGVQKTHPFMDSKVISEACYSSTTSQSTSVCPGGASSSTASGSGVNCTGASGCDHGTHVAGIVAGRSSTMSGVARDASIIAVQVFSKFSSTTDCGSNAPCVLTWNSDQIKGLERVYALRSTHNIAAVNMSLGGGNYTSNCDSDSRKPIIDQLKAAGIATVIASGNNGYTNAVGAPSCISTAVTVGSTTKSDVVASYSNSATLVDLLAPGSSIYSSIPTNSYASFNGTSMATPHVAGAFAVLKSVKPTATVDQIESALKSTGTSVLDTRNNISKPRIQVAAAVAALVPVTPKKPKGDFNGDGKSDILWRHAGNGQNWMWLMNGASQSAIVNFNNVADLGWKVAAKGDFDGDGKADIFWRKTSTGESWVYLMNGTSIKAHGDLSNVSSEFVVAGTGDLDGDSYDDIVWRSTISGDTYVWYMTPNGNAKPNVRIIKLFNESTDWQIHAVADFNGDGKADLFWRKPSTNHTYIDLMNGSSIASGAFMQAVSSTKYVVAGTGDLNGDGKEDIVWRDQTNGENYVWLMNGINSPSVQLINTVADQAWKIEEIGDYNGNGKADLFWRKSTSTGENWIYLMNGSSITSSTSVAPTVHIDYKVVP